MESIEVYTRQAVESTLKAKAKTGSWYVLRFNNYTFKIYNTWASVMEMPSGARQSGSVSHKTQKAFVAEIMEFIK